MIKNLNFDQGFDLCPPNNTILYIEMLFDIGFDHVDCWKIFWNVVIFFSQ